MKQSSTQDILALKNRPNHICIIMDGNGRWANSRGFPRTVGHVYGVKSVKRIVQDCHKRGIEYLTLFAFSSENWRRSADEVGLLKQLFLRAMTREIDHLHENNVRLKLVGDLRPFGDEIYTLAQQSMQTTKNNTGLTLTVCANYGGRWDILNAISQYLKMNPNLKSDEVTEADFSQYLSMSFAPEPDVLIRTGGECRISNFLLWDLAYTEMYFTSTLWPDFNEASLEEILSNYALRERRFGRSHERIVKEK